MEGALILNILVLLVGFYMAWNIGANDVSNAMGTSVGSGALTLRRAVILAAILEFSGAFFVGSEVSETMQRNLIDTSIFINQPKELVLGMCAALLGTGVWLQIASYFGWPVSTTHAIVGAIVGFGIFSGGWQTACWHEISAIAISWVISPAISGVVSYLVFTFLQRNILYALSPTEATRRLLPLFFFIVFFTFTLSLLFNGFENVSFSLSWYLSLLIASLCGLAAAAFGVWIVRRAALSSLSLTSRPSNPQIIFSLDKAIKHLQRVRVSSFDETHTQVVALIREAKMLSSKLREETRFSSRDSEYSFVEKMFTYLQIISACYVAFSHGANDVANAIGPMAAILDVVQDGKISNTSVVPSWLLALGGFGIVIGLATWGWRVIATIGKKITELTPTRGFCAEFGAATTILVASKCGLPISTTHCLVGAVLGVGLARGLSALNLRMIRDIVLSWVITIPASAVTTISCYYILHLFF